MCESVLFAYLFTGSEDEESTASPRSDHVADLVALEVIPDRGEVVEIDHIPDSQFPDTTIDIPALELAERFDDEKFGSQLSPDSGMGFVKPSDSDRTDNSSSSCTSLDRYEKKFEPAEQVVEITQTQHSVENDYRLACELAEEFSLKGETEGRQFPNFLLSPERVFSYLQFGVINHMHYYLHSILVHLKHKEILPNITNYY